MPVAHTMASLFFHGIFYALLLFVTVHTLFTLYHWFTFGQSKHAATVAAAIYVSGIVFCFILMTPALLVL